MDNSQAKSFRWTHQYLVEVLTTGRDPIVKDPVLIVALNNIDRADFVPDRLKSDAYRDYEMDIGYGEKLTKPTVIAQMLSLMQPKYGGKYLDIGSGTGYLAMLLAYIVGDEGFVYSVERLQYLWEQCRANARKYPKLKNVNFLYRDGLEGLPAQAPFDGIHIGFALDDIPDTLKSQLKVKDGIMVVPTLDYNLRVIKRLGIDEYEEEIVPGFVFKAGKEGIG